MELSVKAQRLMAKARRELSRSGSYWTVSAKAAERSSAYAELQSIGVLTIEPYFNREVKINLSPKFQE